MTRRQALGHDLLFCKANVLTVLFHNFLSYSLGIYSVILFYTTKRSLIKLTLYDIKSFNLRKIFVQISFPITHPVFGFFFKILLPIVSF
jgi:hypothetical protein